MNIALRNPIAPWKIEILDGLLWKDGSPLRDWGRQTEVGVVRPRSRADLSGTPELRQAKKLASRGVRSILLYGIGGFAQRPTDRHHRQRPDRQRVPDSARRPRDDHHRRHRHLGAQPDDPQPQRSPRVVGRDLVGRSRRPAVHPGQAASPLPPPARATTPWPTSAFSTSRPAAPSPSTPTPARSQSPPTGALQRRTRRLQAQGHEPGHRHRPEHLGGVPRGQGAQPVTPQGAAERTHLTSAPLPNEEEDPQPCLPAAATARPPLLPAKQPGCRTS